MQRTECDGDWVAIYHLGDEWLHMQVQQPNSRSVAVTTIAYITPYREPERAHPELPPAYIPVPTGEEVRVGDRAAASPSLSSRWGLATWWRVGLNVGFGRLG